MKTTTKLLMGTVVLALLFGFILAACGAAGTYEYLGSKGVTLELKSNKTYTLIIDGTAETGKWSKKDNDITFTPDGGGESYTGLYVAGLTKSIIIHLPGYNVTVDKKSAVGDGIEAELIFVDFSDEEIEAFFE
jgi:hypothetical protein